MAPRHVSVDQMDDGRDEMTRGVKVRNGLCQYDKLEKCVFTKLLPCNVSIKSHACYDVANKLPKVKQAWNHIFICFSRLATALAVSGYAPW